MPVTWKWQILHQYQKIVDKEYIEQTCKYVGSRESHSPGLELGYLPSPRPHFVIEKQILLAHHPAAVSQATQTGHGGSSVLYRLYIYIR